MSKKDEWIQLIEQGKMLVSNMACLRIVNDFFNQNIRFLEDLDHYGAQDYWATPIELLSDMAGDCEDFSIAKYFTLREMGVSDRRLSMCYCKQLQTNDYHMVLLYETDEGRKLVLDNMVDDIHQLQARPDLYPIYSFNSTELWIEKAHGETVYDEDGAKRLSKWQTILEKYNK